MNIEDIKQANMRAGYHFFDASAMRFFKCRLGQKVYGVWFGSTAEGNRRPGGQYFITSERFDWNSSREYTVRRFDPEKGNVSTVGEFGAYKTSKHANIMALLFSCREQSGIDLGVTVS